MSRYDLVLIDADETLFDFARAERGALEASMGEIGVAVDARGFETYIAINKRAWAELEAGTLDREELKTRRFVEFFEAIGLEGPSLRADAAKTGRRYLELLAEQAWLIEGAVEVCAALRARARLVLLTNGIASVQRGRIGRSALRDAFDAIVISEETGYAKPDPRIFGRAAELAGIPDKARMLMVGDSLASDIQGGVNFGIDTCWYNPSGSAPGPASPRPTWVIADLTELKAILA